MLKNYVKTVKPEKVAASSVKRVATIFSVYAPEAFYSMLPFWLRLPIRFIIQTISEISAKNLTLWALTPASPLLDDGSRKDTEAETHSEEIIDGESFVLLPRNDEDNHHLILLNEEAPTQEMVDLLTQYKRQINQWVHQATESGYDTLRKVTLADLAEKAGGTLASTATTLTLFIVFPPGACTIPVVLGIEALIKSPSAYFSRQLAVYLSEKEQPIPVEYISTQSDTQTDIESLIDEFEILMVDEEISRTEESGTNSYAENVPPNTKFRI